MWDWRAEAMHEALRLTVFRWTHLMRDKSQILRINFSLERERREQVPALYVPEDNMRSSDVLDKCCSLC